MATHSTLSSLFTDIANTIRQKTGSTETLVADEFPTAIAGITGETETKTATITANGTTEITPTAGKTMSKVTVTTNVPTATLEHGTSSITANGSYTLEPSSGYDGFEDVVVTVAIPTYDGSVE